MTDLFFFSENQKKTYKLCTTPSGSMMFWISVYKKENGGFLHARGADFVECRESAFRILEAHAVPIEETDYVNALKDYFAIDKKVRETFIQTYHL